MRAGAELKPWASKRWARTPLNDYPPYSRDPRRETALVVALAGRVSSRGHTRFFVAAADRRLFPSHDWLFVLNGGFRRVGPLFFEQQLITCARSGFNLVVRECLHAEKARAKSRAGGRRLERITEQPQLQTKLGGTACALSSESQSCRQLPI